MFGELRMPLGIERENAVNKDLQPTTVYFNEQLPDRPKIVFFPGIVPTLKRTFLRQVMYLKTKGRNLVGFEYPNRGFNINDLENALLSVIGFDEKVSIIASSFGTRVITEILLKNPRLATRVNSLTLFGPFMYLDRESTLNTLASVRSAIPFPNLGLAEELLVRYARSRFNYDPLYYSSDQDRYAMQEEIPIEGLGARMRYFSIRPELKNTLNTYTTIVWWDREPASAAQRAKIESLCPNSNVIRIEGHHGFLQSGADSVNGILEGLISSDYM